MPRHAAGCGGEAAADLARVGLDEEEFSAWVRTRVLLTDSRGLFHTCHRLPHSQAPRSRIP